MQSFTLTDLGCKDLSFQTSLRGYADIRNGSSSAEQLRVLRGVFVYAPRQSNWELRGGQQWLTEGVGRGNLAGLWAKYKMTTKTSITAYGGAKLANSLYLNVPNEEQGYAGGLHAKTQLRWGRLGASCYYLAKRGDLLYHAAGADYLSPVWHDLTLRGRLDLNLSQSTLEQAQLMAAWQASEQIQVTGELRRQTPRIYEDSFFTLFLSEAATDFVRGAVRWNFYESVYCKGGATALFSEGDSERKLHLAFGIPMVEAGYSKWLTVAKGELDGLYIKAHYQVTDKAEVFGGYDFARGSNSDLKEKTDSQVAYLGCDAAICKTLSFTARGEQIQDIERKSDYRGLFSITARFSTLR
jgi:hypothetical protein